MSSGSVGQLYPQGWERQGFATSVVGHCDGLEMGERGQEPRGIWEVLFAGVVM